MRRLVAIALLLCAAPAAAQTPELDRLRLQSVQQQNMRAQEQQTILRRNDADVRQAVVDQQRRQTDANLRSLPAYSTPQAIRADPAIHIEEDAQAMRRLQDAELAASNARLRAIAPAP